MMRLGRSELSAVRPRESGDPGSRFGIACLALGSRFRGNERMSEPEAVQPDFTLVYARPPATGTSSADALRTSRRTALEAATMRDPA